MKPTRHSAEQIVKKLHEAAAAPAGGKTVEEVFNGLRVRPATYHRWLNSRGLLELESKAEMRSRGLPSPDRARRRAWCSREARRALGVRLGRLIAVEDKA